jgi:L-iditol 2-dehydrogenase
MKAVRLHALPNDTRLDELSDPLPGPGKVIARLKAATICANDWKMAFQGSRGIQLPVPLGHELAGVVESVGDGVKGYQPGDRVCIRFAGAIYCGHCFYCLRGMHHYCENWTMFTEPAGWVELMSFSSRLDERLLHMPDNVNNEEGALVEPLACSLAGVERASIQPGEDVVIIGAGAMGLFTLQLALLAGAGRAIMIDTVPMRLEIARQLGAFKTVDFKATDPIAAVKELTHGRGAASVIECSGSLAGASQAVQMVRKLGTVVYFAGFPRPADIQMDANLIHYGGFNLTGTSGSSIRHSHLVLDYLHAGRLDVTPVITHRYNFENAKQALELAATQSKALKIVMTP